MVDSFVISAVITIAIFVITIAIFVISVGIVKLTIWLTDKDSKKIGINREDYDNYEDYELAKLDDLFGMLSDIYENTSMYDYQVLCNYYNALSEISEGHKSAKQNREH